MLKGVRYHESKTHNEKKSYHLENLGGKEVFRGYIRDFHN